MAPMDLIDEEGPADFPALLPRAQNALSLPLSSGGRAGERRRVLKEFLVHDYPCCVPSGLMYRAEAFREAGGFDTRGGFALDLDLDMRIAAHHDFYYIDQVLSSFRYTPISLTSTMHARGQCGGVLLHHAQNPGRSGGHEAVSGVGARETGAGQPVFLLLPGLAAQRHGGAAGAQLENHRPEHSG